MWVRQSSVVVIVTFVVVPVIVPVIVPVVVIVVIDRCGRGGFDHSAFL